MTGSMSRAAVAAAATCLATCEFSIAQAGVVSLQAAHDNTLFQTDDGSLSDGSGSFFFAGNTAVGLARRGLISFDFASLIPVGSRINSVSLRLHMSLTSAGAQPVSLHRLLTAWGEGASDAPLAEGGGTPAAPGDATWLHTFFPGSFWRHPGGDFDSSASDSQIINDVGFYTFSSRQMADDVQQWLSNPASNFGWLLMGNESIIQTTKRFDSRENATLGFRPELMIEYTAVPAPGAAALLLGALAHRRRQRR